MGTSLQLERLTLKLLNHRVKIGSFAIDSKPVVFHSCRDKFEGVFKNNTKSILLKHYEGQNRSVSYFLNKFELILELNEFSSYASTGISSVLWVKPSNFWLQSPLRRSLFTAVLRVAILYKDGEEFEKRLFSYRYFKETKPALKRFLLGYTECRISGNLGWRDTFRNKSEKEIKNILVRPNVSYIDSGI